MLWAMAAAVVGLALGCFFADRFWPLGWALWIGTGVSARFLTIVARFLYRLPGHEPPKFPRRIEACESPIPSPVIPAIFSAALLVLPLFGWHTGLQVDVSTALLFNKAWAVVAFGGGFFLTGWISAQIRRAVGASRSKFK